MLIVKKKKKNNVIGKYRNNSEINRTSNRYFSGTFFLRKSNDWKTKVKGNNKNRPTAKGFSCWHKKDTVVEEVDLK